jgi:hypothetical protein
MASLINQGYCQATSGDGKANRRILIVGCAARTRPDGRENATCKSADSLRSSLEPSRALCEALAARSSVGKMNDDLGSALPGDSLGNQLGGFPGRVVTELPAAIVADDPVVEAVVRNDVKWLPYELSL